MSELLRPAPRRVDPRRVGVVTAAGLTRIVLGGEAALAGSEATPCMPAAQPGSGPVPARAKPLRSAGPFRRCIAVAVQADRGGALGDHAKESIAAAALLAAADCEVRVVVLGSCRDDPAALGADHWLACSGVEDSRYQPERWAAWLRQLQQRWSPEHWLLPDAGLVAEVGRRFAVAARLTLACGVVELGPRHARQRASPAQDLLQPHARVMLLARQVASCHLPFIGHGHQEAVALPAGGVEPSITDLGICQGEPGQLSLEEADFIVAAGNGVSDLPLFHSLALALRAATGASRVAVDDGRFPRHQQIGATGKTVAASAYLALGISGAVQHLQGIKDCRHVIAVNLDAAAPITRRAALTVVEDSGRLMQALLALVREQRVGAV